MSAPSPPPPGSSPPPYALPPAPAWLLPQDAYTPWSKRVWAFLIDWTPIWAAFILPIVGMCITGGPYCVDAIFTGSRYVEPCTDPMAWSWMTLQLLGTWPAALVYFLWNFAYRQGMTGQSVGKSVMKFWVLGEKTWQPIGFWRSLARQLAHYADQAICYVGFLFPLWDAKRQTLADKALSTVCVPWRPAARSAGAGVLTPQSADYPSWR